MRYSESTLVHRIRAILEDECIKSFKIPQFRDFPKGSCSDASEILGFLLEEYGYGPYQIVSGSNSIGKTHTWLQNKTHLIDITADQFSCKFKSVIIEEVKDEQKSHIGFKMEKKRYIDAGNIFKYGSGRVLSFVKNKIEF